MDKLLKYSDFLPQNKEIKEGAEVADTTVKKIADFSGFVNGEGVEVSADNEDVAGQ